MLSLPILLCLHHRCRCEEDTRRQLRPSARAAPNFQVDRCLARQGRPCRHLVWLAQNPTAWSPLSRKGSCCTDLAFCTSSMPSLLGRSHVDAGQCVGIHPSDRNRLLFRTCMQAPMRPDWSSRGVWHSSRWSHARQRAAATVPHCGPRGRPVAAGRARPAWAAAASSPDIEFPLQVFPTHLRLLPLDGEIASS
jgi:hypothetical protein